MTNTKEVPRTRAMIIEKVSLKDFIEQPSNRYFVLMKYKFLRVKKVEIGPHAPSPIVHLASLDTASDVPKEDQEVTPYMIHDLNDCLFRLHEPTTSTT